jgi:hypothetical protein
MAGEFYSNDQCVQYIHNVLDAYKGNFTAGNQVVMGVYYGDVNVIREYPAIVVVPMPMLRVPRETGYFLDTFTINVFIYHANITKSKTDRNKEDMQLATQVTRFLHSSPHNRLGGGVIQGWVQREESGRLIGPRGAVVGTRLEWTGMQREPLLPT